MDPNDQSQQQQQQQAPAPTPTPAVAPAPAPTPAPEPTLQVQQQVNQNYLGASVLDTSINVFSASTGVSSEAFQSAIAGALKHNDASLIDYSAITAGLKPDQAAQAKALAQAAFNETSQRLARDTTAVHALAGGQEKWNEAVAAFNANAPAYVKSIVNEMLERGDLVNVGQFVLDTVRGGGMVTNGVPPVQGGVGTTQQGLTKEQFYEEIAKLNKDAGNKSWQSGTIGARLQELMARRALTFGRDK